jgi:hypothetical protein
MKSPASVASLLAAVAILGTALAVGASDEKPGSNDGFVKSSKQCCVTGKKAACREKSCPCQVADTPAFAGGGNVCNSGKAGPCRGNAGAAKTLTSEVASEAFECKQCPKAKGGRGAKAGAGKCKRCNAEDCKEECDICAEARKKSTAVESDTTTAFGNGMRRGPAMGRGHAGDPQHEKDHKDFFFLIENRDSVSRTVKNLHNGIETLTESDVPEVAATIQEHVEAMYDRMETVNPIRMRDPLFREIFSNTDKIEMNVEHTDHGVRVTETSEDAYVAKLLQEHARVVSLFIKNGYAELPKNHAAPER